MLNRRSLILGAAAIVAAPAIVRASSWLRVPGELYELWEYRCLLLPPIPCGDGRINFDPYLSPRGNLYEGAWTFFGRKGQHSMYTDKVVDFRKREFMLTSV
jgi:hypothetical protein